MPLPEGLFYFNPPLITKCNYWGYLGKGYPMHLLIKFTMLFLLLGAQSTLFASGTDSTAKRFLIGTRGHLGAILIHTPALNTVRKSNPWGAELDLGWQYVSQRAWDFCNCYPRAGLAMTFWDWGNRPVLGHGITGVIYLEPIFLTRRKIQFSIRMGGGLAWMSKPFHPTRNPGNQAYSTSINFPLMVNAALNYRIDQHWNFRLSGDFNHVSNGGLRLPNKGINYPTVGLGMDYAIKAIDFVERAKNERKIIPSPRTRFSFAGLLTFKNGAVGNDDDQYGVYGGTIQGVHYLGKWSGLNLGAEWVVDNARRARMNFWGQEESHHRGGILFGHEFLLGRVSFSQQLGVYFYDRWKENDPVYQRFGLSIRLTNHIFAGLNLKTHRHVADLLDFRVGWQF